MAALPLYPHPWSSSPGRLVRLMGISRERYLELFDRTNLLHQFPGRHARDDKFPQREARIAADAMRPLLSGRRVVLVGRAVMEAFQLRLPYHTWTSVREGHRSQPVVWDVAVIPHTSGRNRWYNSEDNMTAARDFWRDALSSGLVFCRPTN